MKLALAAGLLVVAYVIYRRSRPESSEQDARDILNRRLIAAAIARTNGY